MYKKLSPQIVRKLPLCMVAFLILLSVCPAEARERRPGEEKEIVILIDCSQSMTEVDENRLAFDFVSEVVHASPRHYRFGVIGYNREVCIRVPPGSGPEEIDNALKDVVYRDYGNAGEGISAALSLLEQGRGSKQILLITDGENMMESAEHTAESVSLFESMVEKASADDIRIDIINLGGRIEDEANVYGVAQGTGGLIYDLESGEDFERFAEKYLFGEEDIRSQPSGRIDGSLGDLTVRMPDNLMENAKIFLAGKQQDVNLTVNCEAEGLRVFKGINYSVIEIEKPVSEEVKIHISSENTLGINAYLMTEYDCDIEAVYDYIPETQMAEINLIVPIAEEGEPVDWFFRTVILVFAAAMLILLCMLAKKGKKRQNVIRVTDGGGGDEKIRSKENDFCGKLLIYVIRSKGDIDFPPESINLFARCSRDMITLEWILDTCGLPLE
ncbi:vWA domain-containing protein [Lachnospiraceae bacterium 54-11]